jgi:hypothetical protein
MQGATPWWPPWPSSSRPPLPDRTITSHTRKRLWMRSGGLCAFPGCHQELLYETPDASDDTIVGKECHIVAQRDSAGVARSPSLLTAAEREEFAALIEHRHSFSNLVLMCGVHSDLIDDPRQGFTVERVVAIKAEHEAAMDHRRRAELGRRAVDPAASPDVAPPAGSVIVDDVPRWARKAIKALARTDPTAVAWLQREVGDPADPGRIAALIHRWPSELMTGSEELLQAVVRQAEAAGLWSHATDAWEHLADRQSGVLRADTLARAAVDAGVGGDARRRERLLRAAESLDPDNPRARLERLDDQLSPEEQMVVLDELASDEPGLAALIACHKAMAALLLADLDGAASHLREAERLDVESLAVRSISVNLRVQRGRIALRDDRAFSLPELLGAMNDAMDLRETMVEMRRWEESGRLLMLAAEVPALLRDPPWAREVLEKACSAEVAAPGGPEVLGDAALRSGGPELALRFTDSAEPGDAVRRIRATALSELPQLGRRQSALEELEGLALGGESEAVHAAFARLAACLPPVRASWDDLSAEVLRASPYENIARSLEILAAAARGRVVEAEQEAEALPDEPWAAEVRLRVAAERGQRAAVRLAATAFLRFLPDASGRLLAGRALMDVGEVALAIEVLANVAHDLNAPPRVRADAFDALLRTLTGLERWDDADRHWAAWREVSTRDLHRPDGRVGAWQVRLVRHGGGRV